MLAQELASSLLKLDASYARKMLRHTSVEKRSPAAATNIGLPSPSQGKGSSFDTNVIMILAVLLCALACALVLNSVVRCALRCSGNNANIRGGGGEGVKKKVLRRMPTFAYSEGLKLSGVTPECAICLSEFASGEKVKVLPRCNHGFHARCIDRWLLVHPSCPTCRQCLSGMCPKVYRCPGVASMVSLPPPSNIINPLDPEGLLIDHRIRF